MVTVNDALRNINSQMGGVNPFGSINLGTTTSMADSVLGVNLGYENSHSNWAVRDAVAESVKNNLESNQGNDLWIWVVAGLIFLLFLVLRKD